MDKRKLRQEIQTLRSLVKTTRTNIMRKLLRDHQLWASKLTGATVNMRAKKKLESVKAITNHLRALKTNQLVKDVLQYQPPSKATQAESGSIADRAVARFRADKKLGPFLQVLEQQYGLGEKNAALLIISKKRKAEKKVKASDPKKSKDENDQKKTKRDKARKKKEKQEKPAKKLKKSDVDEDTEEDQSELDVSVDETESSESGEDDDEPNESPVNHVPEVTKPDVAKKVDRPAKQNSKQAPKKRVKQFLLPEDEDDELGTELVTDSFFVTDTGSSYVAVAPKLAKQDENAEDEEDEPWKLSNKRKAKQEQTYGNQGEEYNEHATHFRPAAPVPEPDADLHPSWAAKQRQRAIQPFAGKKVVFGEEDSVPLSNGKSTEDLHPSWAAKQAQKGLRPFAGKKMVFNEDDEPSNQTIPQSTDDLHPSWTAKQAQKGIRPFTGKKMVFDGDNENGIGVRSPFFSKPESDLHPSWAAKQAQKGLKPFAGKKTVFNADDASPSVQPSFSSKPEIDLHPSWAAKQAQKGIRQFAGKKMVFDADDETTTDVRSTSFSKPESDLHPSWAAKQAQKGIKPFTGKKMTFDDKGETPSVQPSSFARPEHDLHPSWAAKQSQKGIKLFAGKKISFGEEENDDRKHSFNASKPAADLHPSWAAKQAQKGIKPFAGTKKTFSEDDGGLSERPKNSDSFGARNSSFRRDNGNTSRLNGVATKPQSNSSDLHPSWAAKQAQQGIKPFAGKKISFDDDE